MTLLIVAFGAFGCSRIEHWLDKLPFGYGLVRYCYQGPIVVTLCFDSNFYREIDSTFEMAGVRTLEGDLALN